MCGIVAYSGNSTSTLQTLLTGLRRLEYRGYDSAGVAYFVKNKVNTVKAIGKVINLENSINNIEELGSVGIAHTRWATHGPATIENAHPHSSSDKKLWIVHNGIIENYQDIKNGLLKKGIKFESDTDTEVVAKLLGTVYKDDLRKAAIEIIPRLKGAFSICMIHEDEPNRVVGFKMSSPLVVGITQDEVIIASDVSAIVEKTKQVIYLDDGELIDVNGSNYEIVSFENKLKDKEISNIEWDLQAANKGGYKHFLLKEIMEQPRVILDSIRGRIILENADVKFGGLIDINKKLNHINKVILLGVGTSYYSAKLGELYFNAISGIQAIAAISPEFRYSKNILDEHTWVIALSQSGETADTIAAVEEAKRQGALVTGVVNVVGSTISRITEAGIYNHIGPEISVASTKAFTSQSIILLMQAILLGRKNGLNYSDADAILNDIKKLPTVIENLLNEQAIEKVANGIATAKDLIYLGRQYNYPIALEGALKIKEISYIHSEGLSSGELKHGFIALIDKDIPTVVLATKDTLYEKTLANIAEIKARNGKVIAIGNNKVPGADETIIVPNINSEYLQPLVNNVALQLLAYYVAKNKKLDIDQPRNLAKSVTVE